MTNYEMIKSMSIEEMAKVIESELSGLIPFCKADCAWAQDAGLNIPDGECVKCAEKWLREEAE